MRVTVSPERLEVVPGIPQVLAITISNPGTVIGGYTIRVLGADPQWVELDEDKISLFPDETRTVTATVTVPAGLAAGERRMAVQVRELTPPERSSVEELVLVVPEAPSTRVRIDPMSITIGRSGRMSILVENAGNTAVTGWLAADDNESKLRARFDPRQVDLAPGEHLVADVRVKGKRPFAGPPAVRTLNVHLVEGRPGAVAEADDEQAPSLEVGKGKRKDPFAPPDPEAQPAAVAMVLQKALLSRGPIGLVGLLAAITVFAIVITLALSRIVGQSAQDRNLALEIAAAQEQAQTGGSSGLGGTVSELTSGKPAKGVAVAVFKADDLVDPVATLATAADGSYRVNGLSAGDYKVSFRGAGFQPLWFPTALDPENAEVVKVEELNRVNGVDVSLSGEPASISGKVNGNDVEDATVTLQLPAATISPAPGAQGGLAVPNGAATATETEDGAVVDTVPVGADGRFSFAGVPSPSEFDVVVSKEGFATTTTRVDVGAGEERKGVQLNLRKGDGIVKGQVYSAGRPLGGVTLTATSGESSVSSVSLEDGTFTLLQLPTPATYTLVATKDRFASQALSITVGDSTPVTGISMSLGSSSTTLGGRTLSADGSRPLGGVTVTVTDGTQVIQTASRTTGDVAGGGGSPGQWEVSGLAIPGTYTVTFSGPALATQTRSVDLDASGTSSAIDALMQPATGALTGTVRQQTAGADEKVGEVTVEVTSGTTSFTVITATWPRSDRGKYFIDQIPPGSYTVTMSKPGVRPTSTIVEIPASTQPTPHSPTLARAASLSGYVVRGPLTAHGPNTPPPGAAGSGYYVLLYRAVDYPVNPYRTIVTDANGRYSFPDIDAPETYVVEVRRSRGGEPIGTSLPEVAASEQAQKDVRIPQ